MKSRALIWLFVGTRFSYAQSTLIHTYLTYDNVIAVKRALWVFVAAQIQNGQEQGLSFAVLRIHVSASFWLLSFGSH